MILAIKLIIKSMNQNLVSWFKPLLILLSITAPMAHASAAGDYHSYRSLILWVIIAASLAAEYLTVTNGFKIKRFKEAFTVSLLTLLASGAVYLMFLLVANIALALSGLSAFFGVNLLLGCVILPLCKSLIYLMVFKLYVGWRQLLAIVASSIFSASLLSAIPYFA
jgi:hypothetical protein